MSCSDAHVSPRQTRDGDARAVGRDGAQSGGKRVGYSLLNFCTTERRNIAYCPIDGPVRESNLVALREYRRRPSKLSNDFVQLAATVMTRKSVGETPSLV